MWAPTIHCNGCGKTSPNRDCCPSEWLVLKVLRPQAKYPDDYQVLYTDTDSKERSEIHSTHYHYCPECVKVAVTSYCLNANG